MGESACDGHEMKEILGDKKGSDGLGGTAFT